MFTVKFPVTCDSNDTPIEKLAAPLDSDAACGMPAALRAQEDEKETSGEG